MTFLESHQLMKEDSILYDNIKKIISTKREVLGGGEFLLKESQQIILVEKGMLVEEIERKNITNYCRIFTDKQLIYNTNGIIVLRAFEDTTYSVIPADALFDQLEEQNLLSNLFLQLQEDLEKERDKELKLQLCSVGERVELLLQFLIQNYQLNPVNNPTFPSWLNIKTLAGFVNSSVVITSKRVKELADKEQIDMKSAYWRLLQSF
ncbi:TPA: Crp/Fnr family transcriptional regulator [Listeria monocytogenes]|nr:Crp/Fnr family transcriptional regulator [Listeria monocytogenes]